jgi:hypothetical protein
MMTRLPFRQGRAFGRRSFARALVCFALALGLTASAKADAQTTEQQAQALFEQGRELVRRGQYDLACKRFEESLRLDAGMATQFRLAECYEKIGRTASAWLNFALVAEAAHAARMKDREGVAKARAEALEPGLSKLSILVPADLAGLDHLEVWCDGLAVAKDRWNHPIPIDPGRHFVRAAAPGRDGWSTAVDIQGPKTSIDVAVPVLANAIVNAAPKDAPVDAQKNAPMPLRKKLAIGSLGAAVVGLGLGVGAGAAVLSKVSSFNQTCTNQHCPPSEQGNLDGARTLSRVSTAGFVLAGVGVAAGAALWFVPMPAASQKKIGMEIGVGRLSVKGEF